MRSTSTVPPSSSVTWTPPSATAGISALGSTSRNRIGRGFALVDTDGIAGIPVKLENRRLGVTDASGHYLLVGLNPYEPNHVAIDPLALPPDVQFTQDRLLVVPAQRAGVRADFGLHTVHAAVLTLTGEDGAPLPLGSRVYSNDDAAPALVGYDGQVYLDPLPASGRLRVKRPEGGTCALVFTAPEHASGIPVLGPYTCRDTP